MIESLLRRRKEGVSPLDKVDESVKKARGRLDDALHKKVKALVQDQLDLEKRTDAVAEKIVQLDPTKEVRDHCESTGAYVKTLEEKQQKLQEALKEGAGQLDQYMEAIRLERQKVEKARLEVQRSADYPTPNERTLYRVGKMWTTGKR